MKTYRYALYRSGYVRMQDEGGDDGTEADPPAPQEPFGGPEPPVYTDQGGAA